MLTSPSRTKFTAISLCLSFETLTTRLASSVGESLGVSLGGVAKGVGALGQSGVEAAGKAAKGAGSAVQRLFGGQKKR